MSEYTKHFNDPAGTCIWVASTSEKDHFVMLRSDLVGADNATIKVKSFEDGIRLAKLIEEIIVVKDVS